MRKVNNSDGSLFIKNLTRTIQSNALKLTIKYTLFYREHKFAFSSYWKVEEGLDIKVCTKLQNVAVRIGFIIPIEGLAHNRQNVNV